MNLLIKFPDQSQSFTLGVEYGRLLERIEKGEEYIQNNGFPIRIENKELLINTCKQFGYTATFGKEEFEGWVEFLGIKKNININ